MTTILQSMFQIKQIACKWFNSEMGQMAFVLPLYSGSLNSSHSWGLYWFLINQITISPHGLSPTLSDFPPLAGTTHLWDCVSRSCSYHGQILLWRSYILRYPKVEVKKHIWEQKDATLNWITLINAILFDNNFIKIFILILNWFQGCSCFASIIQCPIILDIQVIVSNQLDPEFTQLLISLICFVLLIWKPHKEEVCAVQIWQLVKQSFF